jgi:chromosome partitioning protein
MDWPIPTLADVLAARRAIAPYLSRTPVLEPSGLARALGCRAVLKCENLNPTVDIVGILPTMYDKRLTHSREADEILRENFGDLVYKTRIRKTVRFAEAPVKGQSVLAYEPQGDAAALYRDLAKEVLDG